MRMMSAGSSALLSAWGRLPDREPHDVARGGLAMLSGSDRLLGTATLAAINEVETGKVVHQRLSNLVLWQDLF